MNSFISPITKTYIPNFIDGISPYSGRDKPAGKMSVKKYYLSGKILFPCPALRIWI